MEDGGDGWHTANGVDVPVNHPDDLAARIHTTIVQRTHAARLSCLRSCTAHGKEEEEEVAVAVDDEDDDAEGRGGQAAGSAVVRLCHSHPKPTHPVNTNMIAGSKSLSKAGRCLEKRRWCLGR